MIIIVLITTTTDSSLDSKMYISILYNIINCPARVFYEKKKKNERTNLDLLSIPRGCGGKKQTQDTREAWDTTQFLEFVTSHLL